MTARQRLVLPPGRCLTDIWPHLPAPARRPWLALVAAEARAVRREAIEAQRAAQGDPGPVVLARIAAERDAAARRREELERAVATYRVTRPRKAITMKGGTPE